MEEILNPSEDTPKKKKRMSKQEWLDHMANERLTNKIVKKVNHQSYVKGNIVSAIKTRVQGK